MTPSRRDVVKYGIAGLGAAVGVSGVSGARPDKARGPQAQVNFLDQTVEANGSEEVEVTVKQAFLPEGGFVVIHNETLRKGDVVPSIIGNSKPLEAGNHVDVTVSVETDGIKDAEPDDGETELIAMPHRDTNDNGTYDFPNDTSEDIPYFVRRDSENGPVVDPAVITVE